ncbi:Ig-like domain-containing protein [Flavobacterium cellulosilyticum]|uniref:T9SS type A sorting domain-containing protein n=1 Tax=Flavobacterium cellulosilyticum TaxID=2541731 RepID=A0A4R5C900_9FLAO|nr:T9SS type A sorting domain-containing protein [Flavobacterium cellulosilyticum]TDD95269.1 T9SS type A sorting domain-containing protein [Flavobacterium cellulosilyticum]
MKKFICNSRKSVQYNWHTFRCCLTAAFTSHKLMTSINQRSRLLLNYWQQSLVTPLLFATIFMTFYTGNAQNILGTAPVQTPLGGFGVDGNAFVKYPGDTAPYAGDFLFENFSAPITANPGGLFVPIPPTYTYPADTALPDAFYVNPGFTTFYRDNITNEDPTIFTGTNKIDYNVTDMHWGMGSSPNKNEIQNAIAHFTFGSTALGGNPNDLWMVFAADRQVTEGSSYIDFEILQKGLYMTKTGTDSKGFDFGNFTSDAGTPSGRTVGDLLITIEFTQGGAAANVVVRKWNGTEYIQFTPPAGSVYGTNNFVETLVPYPVYNQAPVSTSPNLWAYAPNQWAEGAVNVSSFFGAGNACFKISTLFVRTRTSGSSGNSELKDFPGAPFQLNLDLRPPAPLAGPNSICGTGTVSLTASGCNGGTLKWYATANSTAVLGTGSPFVTPSISSTTSYFVSCTNAAGCEGARAEVIATVNPLPLAPTGTDVTACFDNTAKTGSATAAAGQTIVWYTAATGGTVTTAPSRTAVGSSSAYAGAKVTATGCEGPRTLVTVTINPLPLAPSGTDVTACFDNTAKTGSATAGAGETVVWYTAATGGTVTTAPSRTTVGTSSAYAGAKITATECEGPRTLVTVTINALPLAPSGTDVTACFDNTAKTGSATAGAGETVVWYTAATGGTVTTAPSRTAVGSSSAYAGAKVTGTTCEGPRTLVTVTINPLPLAPSGTDVTACFDNTAKTGSATAGAGETVVWYTAATGGTVTTAPSRTAVGTSSAYAGAKITATECEGPRTLVTVTINPLPLAPSGTDVTACFDNTAKTGSATAGAGETVVWYTAATGGTVTTAPSRTAIGTSSAYAGAKITATGCEGPRTLVTVIINLLPSAPTGTDVTACFDNTAKTGSAAAGAGETVVWYTAATGGTVTTAPSRTAVGSSSAYAGAKVTGTTCEGPRTLVTVTINPLPLAPSGTDVTACFDNTAKTGSATAGAGETVVWYTAATGGTVTTAPSRTTVGTSSAYAGAKITATECEGPRTLVTVTINPLPLAPSGTDVTACFDNTAKTGSATAGAGETVVWYTAATGGTVTTAPSRTTVGTSSAYAGAKITATGCEGPRTLVTVIINLLPSAPTGTDVTACFDNTAKTGSATAGAGETVVWYTAATGGTVTTAPSRTAVGSSSAYAGAKITGTTCEGPRTLVTVTINALPLAPSGIDVTACFDNTTKTGSATAGAGETVVWYTAATGGTVTTAPSRAAVGSSSAYAGAKITATGCEGPRTLVTVTINPLPILVITNPQKVCEGVSVDLTAAAVTAGSTLEGGALSYWTDAAATISLGTPAAVIASGTFYIKVMTSSGCMDIKPVMVTTEICGGPLCTYTQGYYGNSGGMSCAGEGLPLYTTTGLITKALNYYGGTMIVGSGLNTVSISSPSCVINVMPGGGGSFVLTGAYNICNLPASYLRKGRINNTALAQTIALGLNIGINSKLGDFVLQSGTLATAALNGGCGSLTAKPRSCSAEGYTPVINEYLYTTIPSVVDLLPLPNRTVQGLYAMLNKALGGEALPAGITLGALASAADAINNAFDECRISMGYEQIPLVCNASDPQCFVAFEVPIVNNQLTIKYKFAYVSDVTIDVFDISGNKVFSKLDNNSYLDKEVSINYNFNTGTQKVYIVRVTTKLGHSEQKVMSSF